MDEVKRCQVDIRLNPVLNALVFFLSLKVKCFQAVGFKCQPAPPYNKDLRAAIAASLESSGAVTSGSPQAHPGGTPSVFGGGGGEAPLTAPQPSAPPVAAAPPEPPADAAGVVQLALRLPTGTRLQRRFLASHTVGEVAAFVAAEGGVDMSSHALATSFPRRQLVDTIATLEVRRCRLCELALKVPQFQP